MAWDAVLSSTPYISYEIAVMQFSLPAPRGIERAIPDATLFLAVLPAALREKLRSGSGDLVPPTLSAGQFCIATTQSEAIDVVALARIPELWRVKQRGSEGSPRNPCFQYV